MAKKTAREIVEEKMPGKRVVAKPAGVAADAAPQADAVSLDLAALRRKYFGDAAAPEMLPFGIGSPSADTGIVLVTPAEPTADTGQTQTKGVVVSDGEITGEQG